MLYLYVVSYTTSAAMLETNPLRIPVVVGFFTDLQRKIVKHVGTNNNASYRTLIQDIGKDRITIMQCLNSLMEWRYIDKKKVKPEFEKSKLIFSLTSKGIAAACLRKVITLDEIAKNINGKDKITKYVKFVYQTFNSSNRNLMIEPLFRKLDKTYAGYEPGSDEEKNIVRDCFLRGIVDLCFDDNFNVSRLFNNKGIKLLEELYSSEELKEMKKFLVKGRDNISSTIEKFPD